MSCGVGRRHGLDLALLWLWCKLEATALIRPLAWEPPHAEGVALEKPKSQTNKQKKGSVQEFPCGAASSGSDVVTAVVRIATVAWVQSWSRNFHVP